MIDVIWEMSGPQVLGFPLLHVEYDLEDSPRVQLIPANENPRHGILRPTLDASGYFSTGKNSDTNRYEWFANDMVAVEPMLEVRSFGTNHEVFSVHHGVGLSYDFLFGKHFTRFNKLALKFTPMASGSTSVSASTMTSGCIRIASRRTSSNRGRARVT